MNATWMLAVFLIFSAQAAKVIEFRSFNKNIAEISKTFERNDQQVNINLNLKQVNISRNKNNSNYVDLNFSDLSLSQTVGAPRVPFIATIVEGLPEQIVVNISKGEGVILNDTVIAPAQEEDCRCATPKKKQYHVKAQLYGDGSSVEKQYVGKYRGINLTRVLVKAATSDLNSKSTVIYPEMKISIFSKIKNGAKINVFSKSKLQSNYDYLVLVPSNLREGLNKWLDYKKSLGIKTQVFVLGVDTANVNVDIQKFLKKEYENNHYRFALLVGSAEQLVTNFVPTTGLTLTPSDYPYFLMDANDMIPDVEYGRLVASKEDEVLRQTQKWMDYEGKLFSSQQYNKIVGIASNEGSSPSDNEYVLSIGEALAKAYGTKSTHFYENNINSNPKEINNSLGEGASWLTYMGHGSGFSWPSTNETYTTEHIKELNNELSVKPIVIDVACQNGNFMKQGNLGERLVNEDNSREDVMAASMYYGGSVNISWHPPAIMARGMIQEKVAKNLDVLGDILLSGHLHLMQNYSDMNSVQDNFEWYHLFGDPSAKVFFR